MRNDIWSFLFLNFMFIQHVILAQVNVKDEVKVELSKPYTVIDAEDKLYLSNDDYLIALKIEKNGTMYIQSFDTKNLNLIAVNVYKDWDKKSNFEYFQHIKGRFYVYYSLYNSENKTEQLFVREIDPKSAKFLSEGRKIIEVAEKLAGDLKATSFFYTFKVVNKFGFDDSYNGDKFLIYYKIKPKGINSSKYFDVIGVQVFDDKIVKQWSKEIELPYTEKRMDVLDHAINAQGDVFVLAKVFNDDTEKDRKHKGDDPNYHISIF